MGCFFIYRLGILTAVRFPGSFLQPFFQHTAEVGGIVLICRRGGLFAGLLGLVPVHILDAEADLVSLGVYVDDRRLDFVPDLEGFFGLFHPLVADFGDVHQPFDSRFQLHEGPEFGHVGDLAFHQHVGLAIASALGALPVRTHWIDSREEVFPGERPQGRLAASVPQRGNEQGGQATFAQDLPLNLRCEHSEPVHGAVPTLEAGSRVLIMSFSHAEDLDIVAACLKRRREHDDLPFIGLIGSKSKWATFRHRLEARGFSQAELDGVTSPIGVPGVVGKEPEVIAVAVAAQLMQQRR